jgi:hypothetical protein
MSLTNDPNDPGLKQSLPSGQQEKYLVLSEEERAKGFVRPVRRTYQHVGERPKHPLRELTEEEKERHAQWGYVKFEAYPGSDYPRTGRFWTEKTLKSGCGGSTQMAAPLAETYARNPGFYGATFCCQCRAHFPVAEFIWEDGTVVGS